jgi:nitrate reductase molybdenum cofactor assembly chaperone NarJ/NarW
MKLPLLRRAASPPYKLMSVLLQYPDDDVVSARGDIVAAEAALPFWHGRDALRSFLAYWANAPWQSLARQYVATFDFHKRSSLYLTYAIYGDRRQRGMAMLRLKHRYAAAGLPLNTTELPDYLPIMLEFAAMAPEGYGGEVLREFRLAIEVVRLGLHDDASPYALLLDAICAGLPELTIPERASVRRLATEGPPTETVGIEPFAPPEVMPVTNMAIGRTTP